MEVVPVEENSASLAYNASQDSNPSQDRNPLQASDSFQASDLGKIEAFHRMSLQLNEAAAVWKPQKQSLDSGVNPSPRPNSKQPGSIPSNSNACPSANNVGIDAIDAIGASEGTARDRSQSSSPLGKSKSVPSKHADFAEQIGEDSVIGNQCRQLYFGVQLVDDLLQCRQRLRRLCPKTPGVYRWFDGTGRLIYIGKAKSLQSRLLTYYAANPSDEKMRRIRDIGRRIIWEETSHEFLALVREQELIAKFRPGFNVQGQPKRKRPAFLCVSRHKAANLYVSFDGTSDACEYFGPILGSQHLREVAETLNHHFALRDCSEKTPIDYGQQLLLFPVAREAHCLRHEIGTCLGPCAGKVSEADYQAAVDRAIGFLSGYDRTLFQQLQDAMEDAAGQRRFEKAAALRDRLRLLKWVDRRLEDLRKTRYEYNCIYQIADPDGKSWWVLLNQGAVSSVLLRPTHKVLAKRILKQLIESQHNCIPPVKHRVDDLDVPHESVVQLLMQSIVSTWFRRNKDQKQSLMSYSAAIEYCQEILEAKRIAKFKS